MKKIGIITIIDNNNYGNRLQNYAVQQTLKKMDLNSETLLNHVLLNNYEEKKYKYFLKIIRTRISILKQNLKYIRNSRYKLFEKFNKNIKFSKKYISLLDKKVNNKYDFFIVGSDQVWNPNFWQLSDVALLKFAENKKRISFSASFGVNNLEKKDIDKLENLKFFKAISVREEIGKKIIENTIDRKDVEVLVDPTMLLTADEWDKVSKKPEQLKTDKYILNYFLGKLSEKRKAEIDRIAKENNCEVINILDRNSPFYCTGPSEFLYLEKHAFLICTDSFHSSVFAILYNRPFIVFAREDNTVSMNSRIETLINKFNLKNREFNGTNITKENLNKDYIETYEILNEERKKAISFLRESIFIEGEHND